MNQSIMKSILGLLLIAGIGSPAAAQVAAEGSPSRWHFGINARYGKVSETMRAGDISRQFPNAIEVVQPAATIEHDPAIGGELQIGYFFGKGAHWGIGTGLMFQTYNGTMSLSGLRLQYQSTDFRGDVFRQVITAEGPFTEQLNSVMVSVPLVVKYRAQFTKRVGITVDAGIAWNIAARVKTRPDAVLRYEAIYKYAEEGGSYVPVYDASLTPDATSWLITEAQYDRTRGDGSAADYFRQMGSEGYNVALDRRITRRGTVLYKPHAIGFLLQPSLTCRLSEHVGIQLGGFAIYQRFGAPQNDYAKQITSRVGSYESYLNTAEELTQVSYGVTGGLNFSW